MCTGKKDQVTKERVFLSHKVAKRLRDAPHDTAEKLHTALTMMGEPQWREGKASPYINSDMPRVKHDNMRIFFFLETGVVHICEVTTKGNAADHGKYYRAAYPLDKFVEYQSPRGWMARATTQALVRPYMDEIDQLTQERASLEADCEAALDLSAKIETKYVAEQRAKETARRERDQALREIHQLAQYDVRDMTAWQLLRLMGRRLLRRDGQAPGKAAVLRANQRLAHGPRA